MSRHNTFPNQMRERGFIAVRGLIVTSLIAYFVLLCSAHADTGSAPKEATPTAAPTAVKTVAEPVKCVNSDYRIAPRDLVQFQIFEEPDLLSLQRVSESGEIGIPMLGTFHVGGMTLREAEQSMMKAYVQGGFFVKPQVVLAVQTYAPRTVAVLGQVNKPDQISFPVERDSIGLVQAVTLAGGFTRVAKTDAIKVLRIVDGKEQQYIINLAAYLDTRVGTEFMLQPDDVVYVPERVF